MKRLIILAMLVFSMAAIARAQADPCPDCNKAYEEVTRPPFHGDDPYGRDERNRIRSLRSASSLYVRFYASVTITNNTAKKIKRITWETSLINIATMATVETYTLVTRKRIAPHEVITLSKKVEVPLDPRVISADQTSQVKHGVPNVIRTEQVSKIREIEYTDGSVSTP
ncbi:MAG TPA: hypothetical protein VK557_19975 [Pyrinomonadaceae bacterium]|nr:hypothetical protein [Pyrinomonadaceae bacterium]